MGKQGTSQLKKADTVEKKLFPKKVLENSFFTEIVLQQINFKPFAVSCMITPENNAEIVQKYLFGVAAKHSSEDSSAPSILLPRVRVPAHFYLLSSSWSKCFDDVKEMFPRVNFVVVVVQCDQMSRFFSILRNSIS